MTIIPTKYQTKATKCDIMQLVLLNNYIKLCYDAIHWVLSKL